MAGKKRPKSLAQTGTKAPAKTKRPKIDLARQVETRHACPAALRGGRVLGGKT